MDPRPFDVPRYLSMLPLFNDLSPAELKHVADACILNRLVGADMVFRLGEPCNEFHVVVTGQVKLFVLSPTGQEKVVELIGPGQSFGEAIMFTDRPYILNAQALADTLLLTVSKQAVLSEIERDHRFALRMLAGLARRMHGLIHDVEAYALTTANLPRRGPFRSRSAKPRLRPAFRSRQSTSRACCMSWKDMA